MQRSLGGFAVEHTHAVYTHTYIPLSILDNQQSNAKFPDIKQARQIEAMSKAYIRKAKISRKAAAPLLRIVRV